MARALNSRTTAVAGNLSTNGNWLQQRYIQSIMIGLCLLCSFINRINITVAIKAMTEKSSKNVVEFEWSENEKDYVMVSLYSGAVIMKVVAGQLGQRYSPKKLLIVSNLISTLLVTFSPLASYYGGWKLLAIFRCLVGMCQGFVPPLSFKLASKWYPPRELDTLLGIQFSGPGFGTLIALPICGALAYSDAGWPSIFYISATLTLIWTIAWMWLGADSPALHKTISAEERNYIENSLKGSSHDSNMSIPWKKMMQSPPFWAVLATHFLSGYGLAMVIIEMPTYIYDIVTGDVNSNGDLSIVVQIVNAISVFPSCWLAGYLQRSELLTKRSVRILWTSLCLFVASALFLPLGYYGDQAVPFIVTIILVTVLHSFAYSGHIANVIDISPNLSAIIFGIANALEYLGIVITSTLFNKIVPNHDDKNQWWVSFILMFGVSLAGNIIFVTFGSSDIQKWNSPD